MAHVMQKITDSQVEKAKTAALQVLLHNAYGPFCNLPRTAGWGYPEPYTRDLMIASLGILASGNAELISQLRCVFLSLAEYQTEHGHIPSLAHSAQALGASDTTPLFLLALSCYRQVTGEADFLVEAAQKALLWMEYQSPEDNVLVGQLPTSDWRDEQWVLGFGLFVNSVVYSYLRQFHQQERVEQLYQQAQMMLSSDNYDMSTQQAKNIELGKPYYALWAYKIYRSERFDLLGNSLAIISGLIPRERAKKIISWVEEECQAMQERNELAVDLPPNFFPYILPGDDDWLPRYAHFNRPGEYHNGGIWPFIAAFYVVALLAAGYQQLAEEKLLALTELVRPARTHEVAFGFNEWVRAQDGTVQGEDWQTWSAAMYLYAATCVEQGKVLFFDAICE